MYNGSARNSVFLCLRMCVCSFQLFLSSNDFFKGQIHIYNFSQLTFFCGIMAVMGDVEKENRHCVFLYRTRFSVDIARMNQEAGSNRKRVNRLTDYGQLATINFCSRTDSSAEFQYMKNLNGSFSSSDKSFSSKKTLPADISWSRVSPSISTVEKIQKDPPHQKCDRIVLFLGKVYGPFILSNPMRVLSGIIFFCYIIIALYGNFHSQK